MIIGITGLSGVGKTFFAEKLSKHLESRELTTFNINVDSLGKKIIHNNPDILDKTAEFLSKRFNCIINNQNFWDIVMWYRSIATQIDDPLFLKIEEEIDDILENMPKNWVIIIDWALLPKSKHFKNLDKKIIITADNNDRKSAVFKRDNNYNFIRRDKYALLYDNSQYDLEIRNNYLDNLFDLEIDKISSSIFTNLIEIPSKTIIKTEKK